ncbi:MAG: hypothetical protein FWD79_02450 [Desulfobulbus sp.]|nr:hypothetical protein [Desulfobulbus sp.]
MAVEIRERLRTGSAALQGNTQCGAQDIFFPRNPQAAEATFLKEKASIYRLWVLIALNQPENGQVSLSRGGKMPVGGRVFSRSRCLSPEGG